MTQCLDHIVKTNGLLSVYSHILATDIDNNDIVQSRFYFNYFPVKYNNMHVHVHAAAHKLWHDADSKNHFS